MKRLLLFTLSFLFGGAAAFLIGGVLFPLWFDLGWRRPVAVWLDQYTGNAVVGAWGMVWVKSPDWGVATLLGLTLGLALKRTAITAGAFCAAGFLSVPHVCCLLQEGGHPWAWGGLRVAVIMSLWDAIAVPLLFIGVSLGLRIRGNRTNPKSFPLRFSLSTIVLAIAVVAVILAALRYVPAYSVPALALVTLAVVASQRLRGAVEQAVLPSIGPGSTAA